MLVNAEITDIKDHYEKDSKEKIPLEHYMSLYMKLDPTEVQVRCNIPYNEQNQAFTLRLMGSSYLIKFPEFHITCLDERNPYPVLERMIPARILILRYLIEGNYFETA